MAVTPKGSIVFPQQLGAMVRTLHRDTGYPQSNDSHSTYSPVNPRFLPDRHVFLYTNHYRVKMNMSLEAVLPLTWVLSVSLPCRPTLTLYIFLLPPSLFDFLSVYLYFISSRSATTLCQRLEHKIDHHDSFRLFGFIRRRYPSQSTTAKDTKKQG